MPDLPEPPERVRCLVCHQPIEELDDGVNVWWVHDEHPKDEHEAVPEEVR